jgi:adenine specific DNA methylase Mod
MNRLLFGDNLKWLRDAKIFPDACDWHASHYVKVMLDQIFDENNFLN